MSAPDSPGHRPRRPALYRGIVERALRVHDSLALRSEQHGDYEQLFVDADQLQLLRNPDWQVIYGRRGTGKTFLLNMLAEETRRRPEDRVVTIFLTAQDFVVSPTGRAVEDRIRALGYFQTFLELLVEQLTDNIEHLLDQPTFIDSLKRSRSRTEDQVADLLLDLLNLAQDGRPVVAFSEVHYEELQKDARKTGHGHDLSMDGSAGPRGARAGARARIGRSRGREEATEASMKFSGVPVPRYAVVRRRLMELIELLEIEHFNILIDEWSVLDPTAGTSIQPEFADLLKRTFAGSPRISVKIATNRYQTRFSNRSAGARYRGLQIDADIFEATNLDRALLTQANLDTFYEQLLFKRLRHGERELSKFAPSHEDAPDPEFIRSIFRDQRAFHELVKAAEAIPRDFLIIFKSLARHFGYSVATLWTVRDVQQRIREKSVDGQGDMEYQSEAGQLLAPCIKDVVTRTGSRVFLMRREDLSPLGNALDELLEKRLIHEVVRSEIPSQVRDTCQMYLADYGLWLDWRHALGQREEDSDDADLPFDVARADEYVVDPSSIEMTDMQQCPHCRSTFSTRSRAYQVRRLCPECLLAVDDGSGESEGDRS